MRIDSIELSNFRCFERIRVDFHPELTVLVAPNAGGKTAVLDAIAVALSPFVSKVGDETGIQFLETDPRTSYVQADGGRSRIPTPVPESVIGVVGRLDDQPVRWSRRKTGTNGLPETEGAQPLTDFATRLRSRLFDDDHASVTLPIVAYYGTGRLLASRPFAAEEKVIPRPARTSGYEGCLASGSRFDRFLRWYASANFSRLAETIDYGTTEARSPLGDGLWCVGEAVRSVLRQNYGDCRLFYDPMLRDVVLHDDDRYGKLPLRQQSDGVKAIVGLVGDLASRAWLLNPQFGREAARETSGIVLIDEVDMHLHPTWQQGVIQSLRDAFPKVQFILTTHSPQVLSTVSNESIRILQQDGDQWYAEAPDEQTSGGESSYILATVMGAREIPQTEITRKMDEYIVLIEQGDWESEQAVQLREELNSHYGPKHPRILDCDRLIRFKSFKAKRGEAS